MSELYIKKIDETTMLVDGESYVLRELSDYFSFYSEGWKYDKRVRNHLWDGKIRLVNLKTKTTLVGLYSHIVKFCADRNYHLIDQTEHYQKLPSDDLSNFDNWLADLKLPFEPREYQIRAVKYAIQAQRGLLLSPTGCHSKGTKVITGNKSFKAVEDIQVGDTLLGPDLKPRNVVDLYQGTDQMITIQYEISGHTKFDSVNSNHMMHLTNSVTNQVIDIPMYHLVENIDKYDNRLWKLTRIDKYGKPQLVKFELLYGNEEQYYGFELDQDHLYLTEDRIVHHNSGKSLIAYMLVRWMLDHDRKTCLIVPSTSLVEQMINDFKQYAENDDSFDVTENVHGLYAKIKTTDPYKDQCIVSTWQSLINYDNNLFESWDCVICDEAHQCKANSLNKIVGGARNARFKFGMTGSLSSCVCHEFQITGLLGSIYQVTTTKELQNKGQLNQLKVIMVNMKYPADECKQLWKETKELKKTYLDELDFINHHVKRQLFIRNLACSLKGTTLILFRLREHGQWLYDLIKEKVGDSRPVFHIDGKVDAKTREQIRTAINNGNENPILVFSVATSATGLNLPKCENLILTPTKSKITTLQSVGRILRLAKDKGTSHVFDLIDDLRTGRRLNYTYKHAQTRIEIYTEQGFDLDVKEVQF